MKKQTFFDVQYSDGGTANGTPLRLQDAEKLAKEKEAFGWDVKIVPTHDTLWEKTYGDK